MLDLLTLLFIVSKDLIFHAHIPLQASQVRQAYNQNKTPQKHCRSSLNSRYTSAPRPSDHRNNMAKQQVRPLVIVVIDVTSKLVQN